MRLDLVKDSGDLTRLLKDAKDKGLYCYFASFDFTDTALQALGLIDDISLYDYRRKGVNGLCKPARVHSIVESFLGHVAKEKGALMTAQLGCGAMGSRRFADHKDAEKKSARPHAHAAIISNKPIKHQVRSWRYAGYKKDRPPAFGGDGFCKDWDLGLGGAHYIMNNHIVVAKPRVWAGHKNGTNRQRITEMKGVIADYRMDYEPLLSL